MKSTTLLHLYTLLARAIFAESVVPRENYTLQLGLFSCAYKKRCRSVVDFHPRLHCEFACSFISQNYTFYPLGGQN